MNQPSPNNSTRGIHAPTPPVTASSRVLLRIDAAGLNADAAPASILLEFASAVDLSQLGPKPLNASFRVLASAPLSELDAHPSTTHAHRLALPGFALVPGLVNAHTHLDLTAVGPKLFDPLAPFADWLKDVMAGRKTSPEDIAAAVRTGAALSLAGGVVAVGDIAGCPPTGLCDAAPLAFAASGLRGTSFTEFFAIGPREAESIARFTTFIESLNERWPTDSLASLGISPHAPYSVGPAAYRVARELSARLGLQVCTHLAESIEERRFISSAQGPQRDMLEAWGMWHDDLNAVVGQGLHPIDHTLDAWSDVGSSHRVPAQPLLAVHINDLGKPADRDRLIARLRDTGTGVVYCPRASEYFGASTALGSHGYRELIAAGVPVALGTDSIINLPPEQAAMGITPWHDARRLVERDGLPVAEALAAITTSGAHALGLDPNQYTLAPGTSPAGLGIVRVGPKPGPLGVFGGLEPPTLLLNG